MRSLVVVLFTKTVEALRLPILGWRTCRLRLERTGHAFVSRVLLRFAGCDRLDRDTQLHHHTFKRLSRPAPVEYRPKLNHNEELCVRLRELATRHPRYGYRGLGALLGREGRRVNYKKLERLYRQQGLGRPAPPTEATGAGHSPFRDGAGKGP